MTAHPPRYLVPFHPKRISHLFTDVLVIGGGLAGLRAATEVDSQRDVMVVMKGSTFDSNSHYAQGGIAGVLHADDSFEAHIADTLTAGGELCHEDIVSMVVREGPDRIQELIRWGTRFDEQSGQLILGREGGHGRCRVAHAMGDSTGREVMRAMIDRTTRRRNIELFEQTTTLDLLTADGVCRGAIIDNPRRGRALVWAKQTILCTGGAGQIYRESTNPLVATGDGYAMGYRAGAELRDMEFMQFHPTVLYIAGSSRNLITEAVRGEGAYLVDRSGHRFMSDYDHRLELAPRDVVAQAIVSQMEKTSHPCVFLNLSHLDPKFVRERFPSIAARCREFGIDITVDRIPVRPGAHYMVGGLAVGADGRTSIPGLWAAGEVTSTGLHGANRLASNSLLEALVYGTRAGRAACSSIESIPDDFRALPLENKAFPEPSERLDLADIRNSLTSLMWRYVGVRRAAAQLDNALESIDHWCRYVFRRQFNDGGGWELQNMLTVAEIMVQAALAREESRGVHFRTDFPHTDDHHWLRHSSTKLSK